MMASSPQRCGSGCVCVVWSGGGGLWSGAGWGLDYDLAIGSDPPLLHADPPPLGALPPRLCLPPSRPLQDLMAADSDLTYEEAGAILAEVAPAGHARRLSLDEVGRGQAPPRASMGVVDGQPGLPAYCVVWVYVKAAGGGGRPRCIRALRPPGPRRLTSPHLPSPSPAPPLPFLARSSRTSWCAAARGTWRRWTSKAPRWPA